MLLKRLPISSVSTPGIRSPIMIGADGGGGTPVHTRLASKTSLLYVSQLTAWNIGNSTPSWRGSSLEEWIEWWLVWDADPYMRTQGTSHTWSHDWVASSLGFFCGTFGPGVCKKCGEAVSRTISYWFMQTEPEWRWLNGQEKVIEIIVAQSGHSYSGKLEEIYNLSVPTPTQWRMQWLSSRIDSCLLRSFFYIYLCRFTKYSDDDFTF